MDNFRDARARNAPDPGPGGSASIGYGNVIPTSVPATPQVSYKMPTAPQAAMPAANPLPANVPAQTPPPAPPAFEPPASPAPTSPPQAPHHGYDWKGIVKIGGFVALALLVLGAIIFTAIQVMSRQAATTNASASRFSTIEIPLAELIGDGSITLIGTRTLVVNGSLQANASVTISPSQQPSNAARGQIYYDQSRNELAYFNGTRFVPMTDTTTPQAVQSLGGQSGQIAVGEGLVSADGSLSNSGVLSLQGQTGNVSLTAGTGIAVDGTTLSNSGVTAFGGATGEIAIGDGLNLANGTLHNSGLKSAVSGSPNITVANDGNGNITISSAGGGTGTVQSPGGTPGRIAKFTGVQTIEDSLISESGAAITVNGDLSVTGSLSLANALAVGNGGTGTTSLATNGVVVGQGAGALTAVTAGGPGLCLISTAGAPQFSACPGAVGVTSVNSQTGAITIANASASAGTVTINDASTAQKGIAQFNSANFTAAAGVVNTIQNITTTSDPTFRNLNLSTLSVASTQATAPMALINNTNSGTTANLLDLQLNGASRLSVSPAGAMTLSGTLNGQTISSTANFTGTLAVASTANLNGGASVTGTLNANTITPTAAMTVGATNQSLTLQGSAGTTLTATDGSSTTALSFQTPTANVTYRLATAAAGTYDICTTAGNCSGAVVSLQNAYNNSTTPELTLDATRGALTIRDNAVALGANLFEVQNNAGSTTYLGVAAAGTTVNGGLTQSGGNFSSTSTANASVTAGGSITITAGSASTWSTSSGNLTMQAGGTIELQDTTNITGDLDVSGALTAGTANAFQVTAAGDITAAGSTVLQGGTVTLGTASVAGSVVLHDGSTNTGTIQVAALGQNTVYTLPDPGAGTATICLSTGNCAGVGGTITGSGTIGTLAKFTATGSIGDSLLSENAGVVTVSGNLNLTTGSQYRINGAQISSANLSNNANLAKLDASQTFTNDNAFGGNVTLGDSAADALTVSAVLQGATPLTFEGGTADANELSLAIGTLTADRTITLPDEDGTICLQSSTNCGFAVATGGSGYIQNQAAAAQLANFYIQSAAAATAPTAALRLASGQTGNLLELQDTSGNISSRIDSSGFMHIDRAAATSDVVFTVKATADTQSRLTISADGKIGWGSGSAPTDNFITRTAAGALEASNQFTVLGGMQVGAAGFLGKLTIQGGSTSTVSQIIRAVAGQTADQIQLQDSAGNINASFNPAGNQLTLGRVAASGTVTQGKVVLADGTTSNFGLTLQTATLTANRTITLPNEAGIVCLQGSTTCGFALTSGSANYIQNSTVQQTANMNIISAAAGSIGARIEGAANMSAQALLVRSGSNPSANAFEVQNSTGSQLFAVDASNTRVVVGNGNSCSGRLCVGQSVSGAGGGTSTNMYNINSIGTTAAATVIGHNIVMNDTSTAVANTVRPFIIDTSGSTNASATINSIQVKLPASAAGTALQIQNGSTDIVNISNSGSAAFRTTTDSTTGFTIQGNAGVNVFTADTFNNTVRLRSHLATNVSTYDAIWLQTPKNSVTAMIGGDDDTSTYTANDFSGNLRWNGSNVGWGDIGFYPQGGDTGENGHFRFSTTGSAVNTTPNAKVGVGDLYVAGNTGLGTNNPSHKLHVVGSAFASTSVLTPLLDTAVAGALAIGTTNATGINLNQNTTIAATKTLTVTSGATSLTGATTGDALVVSNSTSTGNIAVFRDNATAVATIADGGAATFQNSTNSASAFRILNSGGDSMFNVDATNGGAASLLGLASGEVSPWQTTSAALPSTRYGGQTVTSNGYVYYVGGNNSSHVAQTSVYSARLKTDGTIDTWSTSSNPLPSARARATTVVSNGYVYVMGGQDAAAATINTVYYAKLYADGTTSSWSSTSTLPGNRRAGTSVAANGYVYYMGGQDNSNATQSTSYYAKVNPDGSLGSWTTTTAMTQERYFAASVTANGYVYILGGTNNGGTLQSTVYYARLNSNGTIGTWSTGGALPGLRAESSATVMNGHVYMMGGSDAGGYIAAVNYAKLNADGSVGSWNTSANPLTASRASTGTFVANGYVYIVGGYNGSTLSTIRHTSTARVQIGASLDLVGLQGQTLADPGEASSGSTGGNLTAGNGLFVGSLQSQGLATFNQGATVNGGLNVLGATHIAGDLNLSTKLSDTQGFESTTFVPTSPGTWTTGGNTAWSRTTAEFQEGAASAGSGAIGHSQSSWMDLDYTFTQSGIFQFSWRVSSEKDWDYLVFCVDNDSCTISTGFNKAISGETEWADVSVPITAGARSFRWLYGKDDGTVGGTDKGWVDNVRFTGGTGKVAANYLTLEGNSGMHFDTNGYNITIGEIDNDAALLVLDESTDTGDPDGINGAMYYSSYHDKFRCYENGEWLDCVHTPYTHRYYASGAQSVANATDTKINFATTEIDDGDVSVATNNTFTLNKPGIWLINASVRFGTGTGGTGERYLTIATCVPSGQPSPRYGQTTNHQGGSYSTSLSTSATERFADGAQVCIYGYQNSSGALNTDSSWNGTSVSFTWIGY